MNRPRPAPLASQLIRRILPVYLTFAIVVILIQIVVEYRDTRAAVLHELDSTASAFEPAVTDALWNYQLYLLPQLAQVIVSAGAVTGIDIGDARKLYVTHVPHTSWFGGLSKHIELFHTDSTGARVPIGYIALYSEHDVVIARVKTGVLLVLAASGIMTLGLWLIVVFFVNRVLARPLRSFTDQIASIDLGGATRAPRLDLGSGPSAELGYLRDTFAELAERALHSRKLAVQKEAAEAANVAKTRFLAAASHDLRQPVHAMNLYLGTLARLELSVPARELLAKIRACADTMEEMFLALLDMSRLDAAAVQAQIGTFALAPMLDRLRLQFEPEARAKGLELRIAPCSAFVRTDAAMTERIARNLVANAVRYTERGAVLVGCRRRSARMRIAVYDTGPGIPAHEQRAVFDEFYRLEPSDDRSHAKGMGLGLAIVERLARLLDAPLTLVSYPGRGSMFAVDIPRGARPEGPARPGAQATERSGLDDFLVVVIDDDPTIRDATRMLIEQWGWTVVVAASSAEAVARLSTHPRPPDVLICDYHLHGESGVAAVQTLHTEFNRDIPALLITGDTSPERPRDLRAHGLPILHKPVDQEALRQALSRLIMNRAPH